MSRYITILGRGSRKDSLINYLDKNMWKRNGVWYEKPTLGLRLSEKISHETQLGMVFFDMPTDCEKHVRELKSLNIPWVRVWPDHITKHSDFSGRVRKNIYLPHDPDWPSVLTQVK